MLIISAWRVAKEQAAAILAQHKAESAKQHAAAEAKASEAEAIARETILKHQVDDRLHTLVTCTRAHARARSSTI